MQELGLINLKISSYLKACSASFSQSTECLILYPELLSGHVEGQQLQWLMI